MNKAQRSCILGALRRRVQGLDAEAPLVVSQTEFEAITNHYALEAFEDETPKTFQGHTVTVAAPYKRQKSTVPREERTWRRRDY